MIKSEITHEIIWNYLSDNVCDTCEINILNCKHSTSTFLCEGSRCEDAIDLFIDTINDNDLHIIEIKLRKEKITKILKNIK